MTGWKYSDYALAAALALRHFGNAEILGMSRRRLPEYLESVSGYSEIVILGVSLGGDADRLAAELEAAGWHVIVLWECEVKKQLPELAYKIAQGEHNDNT